MASNPYIVRRPPAAPSLVATAPDAVARFNERPPVPPPLAHADPSGGLDLGTVLSVVVIIAALVTLALARGPVVRYASFMALSVAAGTVLRHHLLPPAWLMEQYARDLLRGNDTLAWLVVAGLAATVVLIARWQYRLKWLS